MTHRLLLQLESRGALLPEDSADIVALSAILGNRGCLQAHSADRSVPPRLLALGAHVLDHDPLRQLYRWLNRREGPTREMEPSEVSIRSSARPHAIAAPAIGDSEINAPHLTPETFPLDSRERPAATNNSVPERMFASGSALRLTQECALRPDMQYRRSAPSVRLVASAPEGFICVEPPAEVVYRGETVSLDHADGAPPIYANEAHLRGYTLPASPVSHTLTLAEGKPQTWLRFTHMGSILLAVPKGCLARRVEVNPGETLSLGLLELLAWQGVLFPDPDKPARGEESQTVTLRGQATVYLAITSG